MISNLHEILDTTEEINSVTWLNHHSALMALSAQIDYSKFTAVGIDGWFLKRLLGIKIKNTSADRFLPIALSKFEGDVVLVGGEPEKLNERLNYFCDNFPKSRVILNIDGTSVEKIDSAILNMGISRNTIFVIGMGAVLQDLVAISVVRLMDLRSVGSKILIFTCGGWMDQLLYPNYYPSFSYKLRLNWFFRLIHEPRRLWKRYTLEALAALSRRNGIRKLVENSNLV
jgi:exopolysaccharide biosynthesis WecB/TagA/CpsF family protein